MKGWIKVKSEDWNYDYVGMGEGIIVNPSAFPKPKKAKPTLTQEEEEGIEGLIDLLSEVTDALQFGVGEEVKKSFIKDLDDVIYALRG